MSESPLQRTFVIFGGSRGLGRALAQGLPRSGDLVHVVSRTRPDHDGDDGIERRWIEADLRTDDAPRRIRAALGEGAVDVLIASAGIWERGWTDSQFERLPPAEIRDIIDTNLTGIVLCIQALLRNLRASIHGRIILIGSTCGLENEGSGLVGTAASKFGLRGVAHALREIGRKDGIAVTCLSPGALATDVAPTAGTEAVLERHGRGRIPLSDVVTLLRAVLELSPAACVKEIHMPATGEEGV